MKRSEILKFLLLPVFIPLSLFYAMLIYLRNLLYDTGLLPVQRLHSKVISIGNIAAGGGGKSPFTMWLALELQKKGLLPAILSRGYGRSTKGTLLVASKTQILTDAQRGGDEPVMMARNLPGIPIVVDENRFRGGKFLESQFSPDCIILDDALQHRKIYRDVEIVLWNSRQKWWDLLPLPLGHQRDLQSRIGHADFLVLTKVKNEADRHKWTYLQRRHSIDALLQYQLQPPIDPSSGKQISLSAGEKALVIAGIAFPEDLLASLRERYPQTIFATIKFPDHVKYGSAEIEKITKYGKDYQHLICTEKDYVKLQGAGLKNLLVVQLAIEEIGSDRGRLADQIYDQLKLDK